MSSLNNSIGLGLSLTFGCLLLALLGEIYYLLWWKRRSWNNPEDDYCSSTRSSAREFINMFCCKKPSNTQPFSTHNNKELQLKYDEAGSTDGLMGLHDMTGAPRILFTIVEETGEDLEWEDGRVSATSSSDLVAHSVEIETPYLTPLSSPSMFPPTNSSYTHLGFNPLFESSELRRLKAPKFKFLQAAEEKFQRRRMMEADKEHEGENPESGELHHSYCCQG